ncbi:MAG: helix-turn-helix transcriptional regulator [Spartobacteria bacterium]
MSESYEATRRRGNGQPLSRRELEVAPLLASGLSTKETAAALGVGADTIESHRSRIYRKLGLHSVVELTLWVIDCGLVKTGKPRGQG